MGTEIFKVRLQFHLSLKLSCLLSWEKWDKLDNTKNTPIIRLSKPQLKFDWIGIWAELSNINPNSLFVWTLGYNLLLSHYEFWTIKKMLSFLLLSHTLVKSNNVFTHKECPDLNGPKSKVAPNFPNLAFQDFFHTTPKSKFFWHIFMGGAMETLQGASKSQNVRK